MESQRDFFEDTPPRNVKKLSSSLPCYFYKWVILFQWFVKEKSGRFKVFERSLFPEIKDHWISGQLKANSRLKKLTNLSEENDVFSLFAKVQSGKKIF